MSWEQSSHSLNNFSFYLHSVSIFSWWLIANNYALKSFNFFLSWARDVWKVGARMHIKPFTMQKIARSSFPINRKLILLSISSSSLMDFNGGYGHKKASNEQQCTELFNILHSCSEAFYRWVEIIFVDAHTPQGRQNILFSWWEC